MFLPDLQVVALKLKDSHLLDEILDRRCVSRDTAELYPNPSDDMVSKMCWLIASVHVLQQSIHTCCAMPM